MTGVAQRTISSTAVGETPSRSAGQIARWSGLLVSASMPWLIALRVVSLPATTSSKKNEPSSPVVSRCRAVLVFDFGVHERAGDVVARVVEPVLREREAVLEQLHARAHELFDASARTRGRRRRGSTFVCSKIRLVSSRGMPIMSQMICSGSAAAISVTKSHSPIGATRSTISRRLLRERCPRSVATWRGVKPRLTISRSLVCFGASMLIIEPSHSAISGGMSPTVELGAEWNVSGSRDHLHHVVVARERPEPGPCGMSISGGGTGSSWNLIGRFGPQLGEDAFAVGAHPLLDVAEVDVVDREIGAGSSMLTPRA